MNQLLLYMTGGCHLCEQAQQVIHAATGHPVSEADIMDNDLWYERYRIRIPVLLDRDSGRELDWPFDQSRVRAFVDHPESAHRSIEEDCSE